MRIGVLTSVGRTLDAFFPQIIAGWEEAGHEVFCAAGSTPESPLTFDLIEGLTQQPSPANWRVPGRLVSWAQDRRLDVVVTNTATASMLVRVRRMPCKLVYFCHGLHWNDGRHPAQLVEGALARRADSIITINSDDHAWLSRRHRNVVLLGQGVGVPEDAYAWSPSPPPTASTSSGPATSSHASAPGSPSTWPDAWSTPASTCAWRCWATDPCARRRWPRPPTSGTG